MKLSTRIVFGFALTNLVYLLLSAGILFTVWPLIGTSGALNNYVSPTNDSTSDLRYNTAEQRSYIRQYSADQNLDPKLLEAALAYNKAAGDNLDFIAKKVNDPASVALRIPEITDRLVKVKAAYDEATAQLKLTSEAETKYLQTRRQFSDTARKALGVLAEALAAEIEAFHDEVGKDFTEETVARRYGRQTSVTSVRATIFDCWVFFLQGYIRDSAELFNNSLAKMDEAEKMMGELINNTKATYPKIREAVERAQAIVNDELAPLLKETLSQQKETEDLAAKRGAAVATLLEFGHQIDDEVSKVVADLEAGIATAVKKASLAMFVGVVVALILSVVQAMVTTRSIVRPINVIIDNLNISAQEVDSASSQLTGASNTLASGATQNAASLEETSAALEELSSMTSRNSDNALEANTLMDQTSTNVIQAETSMTKVITAMEEISRSGNEIGKIIKTIDEIAFQTNLLALNAAVEAARAGEAGAGFAVVADEVRNLAIRSADAAKNTADLIEATIKNINSGSDMVNATAEAFKIVEANATKVGSLVSEVAAASKEQTQGITQISKAMSEMDKVTQGNAATAEESASAAAQLSLQASNLLNVVNEIDALAHGSGRRSQGQAADTRRLAAPASSAAPKPPAAHQASEANKAMPMDDHFDF